MLFAAKSISWVNHIEALRSLKNECAPSISFPPLINICVTRWVKCHAVYTYELLKCPICSHRFAYHKTTRFDNKWNCVLRSSHYDQVSFQASWFDGTLFGLVLCRSLFSTSLLDCVKIFPVIFVTRSGHLVPCTAPSMITLSKPTLLIAWQ